MVFGRKFEVNSFTQSLPKNSVASFPKILGREQVFFFVFFLSPSVCQPSFWGIFLGIEPNNQTGR